MMLRRTAIQVKLMVIKWQVLICHRGGQALGSTYHLFDGCCRIDLFPAVPLELKVESQLDQTPPT